MSGYVNLLDDIQKMYPYLKLTPSDKITFIKFKGSGNRGLDGAFIYVPEKVLQVVLDFVNLFYW